MVALYIPGMTPCVNGVAMSDFSANLKALLAPLEQTEPAKVKLNPRAYLAKSGLDPDEKGAIEEVSESQALADAVMVWATQNARYVHDAVRNDSKLGGTDIALIWELRKILSRTLEDAAEAAENADTNEGDLYEEHG